MLAPDIVATILDKTLLPKVTRFELAAGTALVWTKQRGQVGRNDDAS